MRSRSETRDPSSTSLKLCAKTALRDDVAGATGQGDVSFVVPETMHTTCGDPPSATPSCDTSSKMSETTKTCR